MKTALASNRLAFTLSFGPSSGFTAAIQNIKYVGLSFGSGSFFANGVGVDGTTGSATLQLLSYSAS